MGLDDRICIDCEQAEKIASGSEYYNYLNYFYLSICVIPEYEGEFEEGSSYGGLSNLSAASLTGVIVGIVVAVIAVAVGAIIVIRWWKKKRAAQQLNTVVPTEEDLQKQV